ncbi:DJ-1/PfpI family protein [Vibrio maritimus]|uniref:DJ-1/PfpI family protein n=1 Tax=Vibrio maritimus TaxID=990268 RepID=UPI0037350379
MTRVALLLSDGFEEGEAVNVIDILRRLDVSTVILSCSTSCYLTSYHGLKIETDALLVGHLNDLFDAVLIVGGPPNTDTIGQDTSVIRFIEKHIQNGSYIGALCSAGAKVLAKNNLLGNHNYVCCGELHKNFIDGRYINQPVVVDGQFITGQDYGYTIDFAFAIAHALIGERSTRSTHICDIDWVAKHINYKRFTNY